MNTMKTLVDFWNKTQPKYIIYISTSDDEMETDSDLPPPFKKP